MPTPSCVARLSRTSCSSSRAGRRAPGQLLASLIGLTCQVADSVRLNNHVVLDSNSAKRAQLFDQGPVEELGPIRVLAERTENSLDDVDAGLDREDVTDLDHRGVAEELVLGARRAQLHADVVHH